MISANVKETWLLRLSGWFCPQILGSLQFCCLGYLFFSCIGFYSVPTEWNSVNFTAVLIFSKLLSILLYPWVLLDVSGTWSVCFLRLMLSLNSMVSFYYLKLGSLLTEKYFCFLFLFVFLSVFYSESGDNVHAILNKSVFVFNYQHFNKDFTSL